jgi:hypothetical protein
LRIFGFVEQRGVRLAAEPLFGTPMLKKEKLRELAGAFLLF